MRGEKDSRIASPVETSSAMGKGPEHQGAIPVLATGDHTTMVSKPIFAREHLSPLSSEDAIRCAEYSYRAPSPPFIYIPAPQRARSPQGTVELMPSYDHVDASQLTSEDVRIITRNVSQIAVDEVADWAYENRRSAQAIVDFLYLGPTSVIRDHDFLKREGITMMLVVWNSRMACTLRSVDQAAQELGIALEYIRVDGPADLIHGFPSTIRLINNHLLSVYHSQSRGRGGEGQILMPKSDFRRGKVLIACESGNDRSAAITAAYIMSIFRKGMVHTLQYMQLQRLCCTFDEDVKRMLQSWEDILLARSMVAQQRQLQDADEHQKPPSSAANAKSVALAPSKLKRAFDDMMDVEMDEGPKARTLDNDEERFMDRDPFVPFADAPTSSVSH